MRIVAVLSVLLFFPAQSNATETEKLRDTWTVYIEDGKSEPRHVKLLPAASPLDNYRENLARISPEFDPRFDNVSEEHGGKTPAQIRPLAEEFLTVKELGAWYEYDVFDVSNDDARHRSIILRDKTGNHRILYAQSGFSGVLGAPMPYFKNIQEHRVLIYRAQIRGTGNFYIEYYFLFDPESRLPTPLDFQPIETTLAEILPKDHAVWKGGGFDIETLTYKSSVWKKGDGNCCPTGGSVSMKLTIRDLSLVVVDAEHTPNERP